VFEGIPQKAMVAEDEWLPMRSTKTELKISMLSAILVFNLLMAVFLMDIHKLRKLRFSRVAKFQVRKVILYKGSMAIIGKNKAVVDIPSPKLHFNGFLLGLYGCLSTLFH
jgi:hypothetical protein